MSVKLPKATKKLSALEESFAVQCKHKRLPAPVREFKFCEWRRWRFDFAWPALKIAAECEGGHWSGGRHTRGSGFEKDCEKYNVAQNLGWRVFRFTKSMIDSGEAIELISGQMK